MIKVEVKKEKNKVKEIKIMGHALYDDYGKDIVCASASSIAITTINGILSIDKEAITYEKNKGLTIRVLEENIIIDKLINNMISLLQELSKEYPKNIKFL